MTTPALALPLFLALASGFTPASPLLPPDHWAVAAATRLHELGLLPDWMPAQRAAPIAHLARALEDGAANAERTGSFAAPLARAWRDRFAEEWPGSPSRSAPAPVRPVLLGAAPTAGVEAGYAAGAAPPKVRPVVPPEGVLLTPPDTGLFGAATAAAAFGEHLGAGASLRASSSGVDLSSGELVGALGSVRLSLGRAPVGYGPNQIGAVVASGVAPLDRLELMTTAPFRLPGFLAPLGSWTVDTALARIADARHSPSTLLWQFDVQLRPHPRVTLGAIRGVMFGGALWEGIPAHSIPLSLLGIENYGQDNVYSVSGEVILPTEAFLPLTAKLEWGSDDEPAAAWKWPGLVAGIASPMLPGLPASLGFEYAYFGRGIGPPHAPFGWYSHAGIGGWSIDRTPLGDPLGGNGRAFRIVGSLDLFEAHATIAGAAFIQDRENTTTAAPFSNLYAPFASGRSVGGRLQAALRGAAGRIGVEASYESGRDGWSRADLIAAVTAFF